MFGPTINKDPNRSVKNKRDPKRQTYWTTTFYELQRIWEIYFKYCSRMTKMLGKWCEKSFFKDLFV